MFFMTTCYDDKERIVQGCGVWEQRKREEENRWGETEWNEGKTRAKVVHENVSQD